MFNTVFHLNFYFGNTAVSHFNYEDTTTTINQFIKFLQYCAFQNLHSLFVITIKLSHNFIPITRYSKSMIQLFSIYSLIFDSLCLHSYSSFRYLYVLGQSVLSKKIVEAESSHAFSSWHWFLTLVIVLDSSWGHMASVFSPRDTALLVQVLLSSRPQKADLTLIKLYFSHSNHSFSPSHVIIVLSALSAA